MTLIKSILLGSAAGIVAVATAQAADLPTRKAAPVEYVRVCNVGGITGWTLPGSDTCVKLSGYITAQFEGGNLNTQYNYGSIGDALTASTATVGPAECSAVDSRIDGRIRSRLPHHSAGPDCRQRRSKQPDLQSQPGGLDDPGQLRVRFRLKHRLRPPDRPFRHQLRSAATGSTHGNNTYLNTGYLTWAGITAGKAQSFFSFTGGGDNWANFASPDQKGFNEPDLLAYTASFGGGFTATIAAQSQGQEAGAGFPATARILAARISPISGSAA